MDIRPIRTEADYDWALHQLEAYFEREPEPGTPDGDRFEVLATLVEACEQSNWTMPDSDPVEILTYAIDKMGWTQADLAELLGRGPTPRKCSPANARCPSI